FIGLHLKTEINEALVTNSKHHRSPYISTTFMRFPWIIFLVRLVSQGSLTGNGDSSAIGHTL
ncbi:hypothetical protein M2H38_20010, partial [Vibrio vulnificus]|nr:hypothetical protein [Vibrio vulnificus]